MGNKKQEEEKGLAVQEQQETNVALPTNFDLSAFDDYKAKDGKPVGMEAVDVTDLKLPRIRLLQSNSQEVQKGTARAGMFYNTITKESTEKFEAIFLSLGKSRTRWPKVYKRGEKPLCRSFDAVKGQDGVHPISCSNCTYKEWDNLPEGQNKPDCNMGYTWLGALKGDSPFRMIMSGMGVSITKDFINTIVPQRLPFFVYKVEISSEQKENERGIFYVPKYKIIGTIDPADYNKYKDLTEGMRDLFQKAIEADTERFDEDNIDEDVPAGPAGEKKVF